MSNWRTVQIFLSPKLNGFYETEMDGEGHARCSCPVFKINRACKHTKFVTARFKFNNNHYPIYVDADVTADEAQEAMKSREAFRTFMIERGKIEVL